MNAKSKCKLNRQMTVTSHSPISPVLHSTPDKFRQKQVFHTNVDRICVDSHSHRNSGNVSLIESKLLKDTQRPDPSSSVILRQKLLHRNKNGSIGGLGNASKATRKSYSRSHNNGFKFHNFVVNEDKRSCLEEQHGTKKITVSHWKRPNTTITINEETQQNTCHPSLPSQSILETLLAPNTSNTSAPSPTIEDNHRVSKRKPLHVRRVLRQQRNQSMEPLGRLQPQDEPLDLSLKRSDFCEDNETNDLKEFSDSLRLIHNQNETFSTDYTTESESVQNLIKSVNQSAAQASAIIASVKCPISANFSSNASSNSSNDSSIALRHQMAINSGLSSKHQKNRQTHRSLIKKQLEETFKQNGFLVKTKQVSDANNSAMFCKFRQLRKYTRYYLKSWHHHLPDEVNKLWKGFLPPKTEKPNSSHN
ncbi:unnamed protein product [Medioppia subpectinata]|uniref:Uncharacterized protein n=1 Tax=Medioppia subpectinata TaxID=1979941 RepID=A0A7R9KRJ8_9ACAR|nr:unnamed protein product [Medioppia subpectinata]CAG2108225.1 unnamed protein product [Medioppia subpectinata]